MSFEVFHHVGDLVSELFGEQISFTLSDGRTVDLQAVFLPRKKVTSVGDYGAEQIDYYPTLDVPIAEMSRKNVTLDDLYDATFIAESLEYTVGTPETDSISLITARCHIE